MYRKHHKCHHPRPKCFYKKITKTCVTKVKYVPTKCKKHCHVTVEYCGVKKEDITNTLLPFSSEKGSFLIELD